MFDIKDTVFGYERKLIVCSFLQDFFKGKGISLQLICIVHTAFLLCGAEMADGEKIISLQVAGYIKHAVTTFLWYKISS